MPTKKKHAGGRTTVALLALALLLACLILATETHPR